MKSILKLSVLTALVFALSVNASAQQRLNNPDRLRGDRQSQMQKMHSNQGNQHQQMMNMLDLNEEQSEQIETIHLNGQKSMLPLRNTLREKNARLRTLTTSESYDEKAVNEVIEEISEIRAAMLTMRTSHRRQIRELLTEEQHIKFDSFQQNSLRRQHKRGMNK